AEEVVGAWLVASRLAGHRTILAEMAKQQGALDAAVSYRWLMGLARVLERATRWVLLNVDPGLSPGAVVQENADGLARVRAAFPSLVGGQDRALFEHRVEEIRALGADEPFAQSLITLRFLDQILEILQISRATGAEATRTGQAYYEVSEALDLPWLRDLAFTAVGEGPWGQRAARALAEDLSRAHRKLVVAALRTGSARDLLASARRDVDRLRGTVGELRAEGAAGLAGASVAVRELAALAEKAASS
ncbi:MAG: NAD-glutamate dehydrogenase, partial [Longimicrobiales bacterium]|nr:NAD-glutamate dehydrogenase [Longimicrobiales bacterium]